MAFFEGHGWAQDWITHWTQESDSLFWELNVLDSGTFEVWLEQTASPSQLGTKLTLTTSSDTLRYTLQQSFNPTRIPSPDRVSRKEAPEQTWNKVFLGIVNLKPGPETIFLIAKDIPAQGLGDIFNLRLVPKNRKSK